MAKYNKILVSKVLELREDLGLIVEVNEGQQGRPNDLVLWLQYRDNNGEWQYKGSMGATGIRIPINDSLEKFLIDSVKAGMDASKKFNAGAKKQTGFDVNALNALSDEQKAQLLNALLGNAKQAQPAQPNPKDRSEPIIDFTATLLNSLSKGATNSKKTKK